jgi:hypothetical protein
LPGGRDEGAVAICFELVVNFGENAEAARAAALVNELADGMIDGLVLGQALHDELGLGDNYVEFQPGYLWIPYQGEKPSTLTAD